MRKILQVSIEPIREAERQRGNGGRELAKLRIHFPRDRNVDAILREAATPHLDHERGRRTHAERGTKLGFLPAVARDERDRSRAEFVVYLDRERRRLLAS